MLQKMRAMESTRRKLKASEEKRFWRQVVLKLTSSKALSSEAGHQKLTSSEASEDYQELKITISWKIEEFQCCSNEDLITPIIVEDWKNKATTISNGFEDIGCLFFGERWKRTIVRSVQPLPPLLRFVYAIGQEQQLWLHLCSSRLDIDLKLIIPRTINKSGIRSLVIWSKLQMTIFDVLAIQQRLFHTFI